MSQPVYYKTYAIVTQSYHDEQNGQQMFRYVVYKPLPLTSIKSDLIYSTHEKAFDAAIECVDTLIQSKQKATPQ